MADVRFSHRSTGVKGEHVSRIEEKGESKAVKYCCLCVVNVQWKHGRFFGWEVENTEDRDRAIGAATGRFRGVHVTLYEWCKQNTSAMNVHIHASRSESDAGAVVR
eukprot:3158055-Amphidinium_carterae.1